MKAITSNKLYNPSLVRLAVSLCLASLFLLGTVAAWGVLPARQLASYTQDQQQLNVKIRNTDFDEGFFKIGFSGDLAPYATYTGSEIVPIEPDVGEVTIPFTLQLEEDMQPGKNTLKVLLQQLPSYDSDSTVDAVMTLVADVVVNVPYGEAYVAADLHIPKGSPREPLLFTIGLINKGDDAILVWSDVVIKGPTNEIIDSWTTDKMMLDYLAADKIETYWMGQKEAGQYVAEVTVHYSDKSSELRQSFIVGDEEVRAVGISADKFTLGEINPLRITATNLWNDLREGVYAEVYVLDADGRTVQEFRSSPEDFPARATKDLVAYWDTANLVVGNYDLSVVLNYAGKTSLKVFPVLVSMDKLQVLTPTGQVLGGGGEGGDDEPGQYTLFIILLIVVVVTNVIIIMYFRRSKKKDG